MLYVPVHPQTGEHPAFHACGYPVIVVPLSVRRPNGWRVYLRPTYKDGRNPVRRKSVVMCPRCKRHIFPQDVRDEPPERREP